MRQPFYAIALALAALCLATTGGALPAVAGTEVRPAPAAATVCPSLPKTQSDAAKAAAVTAQINKLDAAKALVLEALVSQETQVNAQKSEKLKEPSTQLNDLTALKLKATDATGKAAIDAQLLAVQKQIDEIAAPFDLRLKELARSRLDVELAVDAESVRLAAERLQFIDVCQSPR